ncbi:glycosyltransferase family 4 protein [Acidobacteriota bacterium]
MAGTKLLLCNHQSPSNFVGGAEFLLLDIARNFDRNKFDILILANEEGVFTKMAQESGISVTTVPHEMIWDFLAPGKDIADKVERFKIAQRPSIEALKKTIRENGIQALLVNCLVNTVPLMAAAECQIPSVWNINEIVHAFDSMSSGLRKILRIRTENSRHKREALLFLQKTILQYSRMSIFITETSRTKIFNTSEWRDRAVVMPPPVRRDVFFAPAPLSKSYPGIPDNAFSVLFLGILVPHKGVHDFIQAASDVAMVAPTVHFTIAGASSDWSYVRKLKKMAGAKKHLDNRIQFTGFLENPLPLIDRADVICMPSLYEEPFGMVVSEGMTRGKVVLAYETGSIRELIEDGKTGYILPRGKTKALSEKIIALLNSPETRKTMGETAIATARARFHPETYLTKLEDIVERVVAQ